MLGKPRGLPERFGRGHIIWVCIGVPAARLQQIDFICSLDNVRKAAAERLTQLPLMKLLLLNFLEAGKSVITLDVEHEQWELCQALGGCFADIVEAMSLSLRTKRSITYDGD